jgi:hypothetical protein
MLPTLAKIAQGWGTLGWDDADETQWADCFLFLSSVAPAQR